MVETLSRTYRWWDRVTDIPWVSAAGTIILAVAASVVFYYAMDRDLPLQFISTEPASARAGEWITIHQRVRRDMTRDCSMKSVRNATDATGLNMPIGIRELTDAERDELERRMPGRSIIAFQVPDNFAPGPALLTMTMRFRCNITQEAFPIVEERSIPFEVLP